MVTATLYSVTRQRYGVAVFNFFMLMLVAVINSSSLPNFVSVKFLCFEANHFLTQSLGDSSSILMPISSSTANSFTFE